MNLRLLPNKRSYYSVADSSNTSGNWLDGENRKAGQQTASNKKAKP